MNSAVWSLIAAEAGSEAGGLFDAYPPLVAKVVLICAVFGGAVLCFFGCRFFRLALALAGLVCGSAIAAYFGVLHTAAEQLRAAQTYPEMLNVMAAPANRTVAMVWAAAGGIAGAILSVLMLQVGVFALGVCLGAMLANLTMPRAASQAYLIVLALLGLAGGVLALVLRKHIVVLSTAFNGALAFMFGVYALMTAQSPHGAVNVLREFRQDAYVLLGCTIILGTIGAFLQFSTVPEGKMETLFQPVLYKSVKKKAKPG